MSQEITAESQEFERISSFFRYIRQKTKDLETELNIISHEAEAAEILLKNYEKKQKLKIRKLTTKKLKLRIVKCNINKMKKMKKKSIK